MDTIYLGLLYPQSRPPRRQGTRTWLLPRAFVGSALRVSAHRACLDRGTLEASFAALPAVGLSVTLRGAVDRRFFNMAGRRIEGLLRRSNVTVDLHDEALAIDQREHLRALLARLARHGDQLSIRMNAVLRRSLAVDSSVFHVILEDA